MGAGTPERHPAGREATRLSGGEAGGPGLGLADPLGEGELPVEAPVAGIVIGRIKLPLVNEGEALYHIARFAETGTAAETVERFQDLLDPETDLPDLEEPPIS